MNCLLLFITFIIVFISTNGQFAPPPWMGPNSFGGPWGPRPWRKRPCNYFDQFIDQGPCRIPGWHRRFGGRPPPPDSNWGQNWQQPDQQMPDQQETSQNWPNQQQQPNQQQPNQQQPSQQQPAATTTRRPGNRPGNGQDPLNILGTATQNAVQTTTTQPWTQPTTTQRPIITTARPLGNRPSINNNDPLNILGNSVVTTTQRPIVTTRPPIVTTTQRATTRPAPVITTTQRATTRPAPVITTTQRQTQRPIVTTTLRIALGPNGKADPNSDAFIPPPPA
ncbi:hypothetical protein M3Y97_00564800 [Aphelenchoides bicaudatus]|nr:hypothetical protein M3Y97_00564800 [Aphelenchoides bicaudatus]